ncbi:MAG: hypothetical protein BZ138_08160 [Methanosphaera sp. rholeuAM270]|nr:MAG: hypothetical protein BZ138_08160 [Methanosphaera sp. rholeuAM270]
MLRNGNKIIGIDLSYGERIKIIAKRLESNAIAENIIEQELSPNGFHCLCRSLRYFEKKHHTKLHIEDIGELMKNYDLNKFS